MPDTAIDPVPKQGKFRRALAAVKAWLQALDYTGFDYSTAPNAWSRSWHS
jgi:hypothetical protein